MNTNEEIAATNRLLDIIRDTPLSDDADEGEITLRARTEDDLRQDVSGLAQIRSELVQTARKPPRPKIVALAGKGVTAIKRPVSPVDIRQLAQIRDRARDEAKHKVDRQEMGSPHLAPKPKPEPTPTLPEKPEPTLPKKRVVVQETPPLYLGVREKRKGLSALFSKNMLGLDIGSHTIKSVQLEKNSSGFRLVSLSVVKVASGKPDAPDYEQAKLLSSQKALENIRLKQVKVVGAVGGSGITIRQLQLPQMSAEELASSIKWESKRHIPYDIHEVELDFQVLKNELTTMDVLLVIVPKNLVHNYKGFMHRLRLKPIVTDVGPLALMNSVLATVDMVKDEAAILLDIGAETTTLNIYNEQAEYFVHYVPVSGNSFTQEIQQKFQLGYLEAEELKKTEPGVVEVIKPALGKMVYDIRKTLTFYKNQTPIKGFSEIVLSGGNACIPKLDQYLADELNLRVKLLNPFQNIIVDENIFPKETLNRVSCQLALAVGLAMRGYE